MTNYGKRGIYPHTQSHIYLKVYIKALRLKIIMRKKKLKLKQKKKKV
jgi:hypothetical protein